MSAPLRKSFDDAAANDRVTKPKKVYPKPVSVRFTDEERSELERKAGDLTLSAYVRSRCVGDSVEAHRTRGKRSVKDYKELSKVLGLLGRSQLPNNVNQIAKALNMGTLDLSHETDAAIRQAAFDIAYIRMTLIKALGLKDGGS